MKVKIIRHAERLDCTSPIYWMCCVGQHFSDTPLSVNGLASASLLGEQFAAEGFNPSHIYVSPYSRTLSTAVRVRKSLPRTDLIIENLLAEYQSSSAHCINLYPEGLPTDYHGDDTGFSYPETEDQLQNRIRFILYKLMDKNDQDILLVTHAGILQAVYDIIRKDNPEFKLDMDRIGYLASISFDYDYNNKTILLDTVEFHNFS
jgi:broad specificity phosphatase PhoE